MGGASRDPDASITAVSAHRDGSRRHGRMAPQVLTVRCQQSLSRFSVCILSCGPSLPPSLQTVKSNKYFLSDEQDILMCSVADTGRNQTKVLHSQAADSLRWTSKYITIVTMLSSAVLFREGDRNSNGKFLNSR